MLIGFSGIKGSGKSYCSIYLQEKYKFVKYSIASPIKNIAMIFGFSFEEVYGNEKEKINEELGITCREFLQIVGTELFRKEIYNYLPNFKPKNIWCYLLEKHIEMCTCVNLVIDDVRSIQELNIIKKYKGIIIHIKNDNVKKNEFSNHSSETEILEFDYEIDNTNHESYEQLDEILKNLS